MKKMPVDQTLRDNLPTSFGSTNFGKENVVISTMVRKVIYIVY